MTMQAELNGHAAGIILIFVPIPFDVGYDGVDPKP